MPMDGCRLWQTVRNQNTHSIAFNGFKCRAGGLSVVAPTVDNHPGRELAFYWLGNEMKLLHAIQHFPGQARPVRRHDRWICVRRTWRGRLRSDNFGALRDAFE